MNYIKFSGLLKEILDEHPYDLTSFLEQRLKIPQYKAQDIANRMISNFNIEQIYEVERKQIEFSSSGETKKVEDEKIRFNIYSLDNLSGREFEYFLKWFFEEMGYEVELTKLTADSGVDLVVIKDDERIAVQAKRYGRNARVSNTVILKTHGGKEIYKCDRSMVVTTSSFTRHAMEDAKKLNVELWDRYTLSSKIDQINETNKEPKPRSQFPAYQQSLLRSLLNLEKTCVFAVEKSGENKYHVHRRGVKPPILSFQVRFNTVTRCVFRIKNKKPLGEYEGYALIHSDRHYKYGPNEPEAYKQILNYLSEFL